jgi:hypothetical protein
MCDDPGGKPDLVSGVNQGRRELKVKLLKGNGESEEICLLPRWPKDAGQFPP